MDNELGRKFEQTRAKSVSAILDFCHGPKTWIPDACERRDFSASNPPGLNLEAICSSSLHCALYYKYSIYVNNNLYFITPIVVLKNGFKRAF